MSISEKWVKKEGHYSKNDTDSYLIWFAVWSCSTYSQPFAVGRRDSWRQFRSAAGRACPAWAPEDSPRRRTPQPGSRFPRDTSPDTRTETGYGPCNMSCPGNRSPLIFQRPCALKQWRCNWMLGILGKYARLKTGKNKLRRKIFKVSFLKVHYWVPDIKSRELWKRKFEDISFKISRYV